MSLKKPEMQGAKFSPSPSLPQRGRVGDHQPHGLKPESVDYVFNLAIFQNKPTSGVFVE